MRFCTLCNSHIYIGSSAKSDVIRHAKTQDHLKLVSFQSNSKPTLSFLPGANSTLNDKIIKAETFFSNLLQNITFRLQFLIISQNFVRKCSQIVKLQKVLLVVELRLPK